MIISSQHKQIFLFKKTLFSSFGLLLLILSGLNGLSSCSSTPHNPNDGRYSMKKDAYPDRKLNARNLQDATVPATLTRTKGGNKSPYTVLGKTYYIMKDSKGFTQTGSASWYGKKFHGHLTSNGETYDMYKMSAAHKTLPIPSYVRVTNLDNKLSTVVRVNDRGPFHGGRIIDLSYAAATKLGYSNKGTARVKIEVLEPGQSYQTSKPQKSRRSKVTTTAKPNGYHLPSNTYLQVAALSNSQTAQQIKTRLQSLTNYPVSINNSSNLFKVRIGPVTDNFDLVDLRNLILQNELGSPVVVYD